MKLFVKSENRKMKMLSNLCQPVLVLGELSLVHCVGTAGIPVITGSEFERTPTSSSKYSKKHIVFSSYESEAFIKELCELGKRLDRKAVLVTYDDRVILNISENREKLKKHYRLLLPDHRIVEQLLDKLQFCDLSRKYDLPVPRSIRVSSIKDLKRNLDKLERPYLIKPAYRHYWFHKDFQNIVGNYKKAYRCETRGELVDLYKKIRRINPDAVIQDYIVGEDSCMYDVNLYVNGDGEVAGYVIAQKMRVYPPTAGWGSYVQTVHNEEIYNSCLSIINKLNLKGMLNIQFKRDTRTDEFKLIEIHTRTSIFDFLGTKAGLNIPALYYSSLIEEETTYAKDYKNDVKYINVGRDIRLFARYHNQYEVSLWNWAKSYLETSVFDGLTLNDPAPVLRGILHK